jgi:hypothetical protein
VSLADGGGERMIESYRVRGYYCELEEIEDLRLKPNSEIRFVCCKKNISRVIEFL